MGNIIDLRKYNINTDEEAIAFLELIVAKAPRIIKVLKKHALQTQSLQSRVAFADQQSQVVQVQPAGARDFTVSERMAGKADSIVAPAVTAQVLVSAEDRIAQMRAANQVQPSTDNAGRMSDPLNLKPADEVVAPGEIGDLESGATQPWNTTVEPQPVNDNGEPILTPDNTVVEDDGTEGLDPSGVSFDFDNEQTTTTEDELEEPTV